MKIIRNLTLGAVLGLLLAGPAWGQGVRKSDYSDTVTVVELRKGGSELAVSDASGEQRVLALDKDTLVQRGVEKIQPTALRPGDRVAIDASYEGAKGDRLVANRIQLVVAAQ